MEIEREIDRNMCFGKMSERESGNSSRYAYDEKVNVSYEKNKIG